MLLGACSSTTHDDAATDDALSTDDAKIASLFADKVEAPNLPSVRGYAIYRVHLTGRNEKAFNKLLYQSPHCKPGSAERDCWAYRSAVDTNSRAAENDALDGDPTWEDRDINGETVNIIADADRNIAAYAVHSPDFGFSEGVGTVEFGWLKGKEALFGDLVQLMRARAQAINAWPVDVHFSGHGPMELEGDDKLKATEAAVATLDHMGLKCRRREGNDWSEGGDCESRRGTPWYQ
jgi:hypothetical protein